MLTERLNRNLNRNTNYLAEEFDELLQIEVMQSFWAKGYDEVQEMEMKSTYLFTKIVAIMGLYGACRSNEFYKLEVPDVDTRKSS